ncbi:MAG: tyrosine-protein phosphatase [Planctomycetes bacterium]|nr:tyrosine-protein phosphatase [Planctomycetota bacterium]
MRTRTITGWLAVWACLLLMAAPLAAAETFAPAEGATVEVLKPGQRAFLEKSRAERRAIFHDVEQRKALASLGWHPQPVSFAWPAVPGATGYVITLALDPDFSRPLIVPAAGPLAEVDNLRIATRYYWKVTAKTASGEQTSPVHSFRTADMAPRLMRIEGVPNARDLGGRVGFDGRRVRQDRVFRTAGMNDNARAVFAKPEDVRKNDPGLAREIAAHEKTAAEFQKIIDGKETLVPYAMGAEWTVFLPNKPRLSAAECAAVAALNAIPATLMDAPATKMKADAAGEIAFKLDEEWKPAVLLQEFTAARDGLMLIHVGADWYWQLAVNGQVVCDRATIGTQRAVRRENHPLLLPVRQGRNVVSVVVMSGSAGWKWCCGDMPVPAGTMRESGTAILHRYEKYFAARTVVITGYEAGRTRLTPQSQSYMLDTLGIKSDIDLRSKGECMHMTGSPLGERVKWFHYSSSAYEGMASEHGRKAFAKVFRVFLDEENYPIVFHCIAGQDRTGAVAFIVNGLLGVSEEELYRDWEATGFWNRDVNLCHERRFDKLVAVFNAYPGANLNAKIEQYVLSLGFTAADIAHLRDILLEPAGR